MTTGNIFSPGGLSEWKSFRLQVFPASNAWAGPGEKSVARDPPALRFGASGRTAAGARRTSSAQGLRSCRRAPWDPLLV